MLSLILLLVLTSPFPLLRRFPPVPSFHLQSVGEGRATQAKKLLIAFQCPIHPFHPMRSQNPEIKNTTALGPRNEELLFAPNRSDG